MCVAHLRVEVLRRHGLEDGHVKLRVRHWKARGGEGGVGMGGVGRGGGRGGAPDAKPPETKNLVSGPPATSCTDTTPGLSSEIVGTWLGITPNWPSPPGRITISTCAFSYSDLDGTMKLKVRPPAPPAGSSARRACDACSERDARAAGARDAARRSVGLRRADSRRSDMFLCAWQLERGVELLRGCRNACASLLTFLRLHGLIRLIYAMGAACAGDMIDRAMSIAHRYISNNPSARSAAIRS